MMKFKIHTQRLVMLSATFAVLVFAGCPDYSHQRPVPNYDEMGQENVHDEPPAKPVDNADK